MSLELTDLIGPGVAVVAVAVGVWQYRLTSLREFITPVREAQLKLYQEASSAAAQIATLQQESPEWIKARQEFLRLYGPLAIVESFDHATDSRERLTVEHAMIIFKSCLDDEKQCNELGANLYDLSLRLRIPAGSRSGARGDTRSTSWTEPIRSLRWLINSGCWRRDRTRNSQSSRRPPAF